jgi:hypothetical protein
MVTEAVDLFEKSVSPNSDADSVLTVEMFQKLRQIVKKYPAVFLPATGIPPVREMDGVRVAHRIVETPNSTPPCKQPYRLSPTELKELKTQLTEFIKKGFITPCESPYGAPVIFAPKADKNSQNVP